MYDTALVLMGSFILMSKDCEVFSGVAACGWLVFESVQCLEGLVGQGVVHIVGDISQSEVIELILCAVSVFSNTC